VNFHGSESGMTIREIAKKKNISISVFKGRLIEAGTWIKLAEIRRKKLKGKIAF
jgi:hypothetical protein